MIRFEEFWDYVDDNGEDISAVDDLNDFVKQHKDISIIDTKYQVIRDGEKPRTFILLQYEYEDEE